jgi:hypothetical protein
MATAASCLMWHVFPSPSQTGEVEVTLLPNPSPRSFRYSHKTLLRELVRRMKQQPPRGRGIYRVDNKDRMTDAFPHDHHDPPQSEARPSIKISPNGGVITRTRTAASPHGPRADARFEGWPNKVFSKQLPPSSEQGTKRDGSTSGQNPCARVSWAHPESCSSPRRKVSWNPHRRGGNESPRSIEQP